VIARVLALAAALTVPTVLALATVTTTEEFRAR
jgi:hypothetical protein